MKIVGTLGLLLFAIVLRVDAASQIILEEQKNANGDLYRLYFGLDDSGNVKAVVEDTEGTDTSETHQLLGNLNCQTGQTPRFDGSKWVCGTDCEQGNLALCMLASCQEGDILVANETGDWLCISDPNTPGKLSCAENEIIEFNSGNWGCGPDSDFLRTLKTSCPTDHIGRLSVNSGNAKVCVIADDHNELGSLTCANGDVAKQFQSGWGCGVDKSSLPTQCQPGEVLKSNVDIFDGCHCHVEVEHVSVDNYTFFPGEKNFSPLSGTFIFKVQAGCRAMVFSNASYRGEHYTFLPGTTTFDSNADFPGQNTEIMSIRVFCDVPEFPWVCDIDRDQWTTLGCTNGADTPIYLGKGRWACEVSPKFNENGTPSIPKPSPLNAAFMITGEFANVQLDSVCRSHTIPASEIQWSHGDYKSPVPVSGRPGVYAFSNGRVVGASIRTFPTTGADVSLHYSTTATSNKHLEKLLEKLKGDIKPSAVVEFDPTTSQFKFFENSFFGAQVQISQCTESLSVSVALWVVYDWA